LCNIISLAALYNLIILYLKEIKVNIRLSLKPEKCSYLTLKVAYN